MSWINSKMFCCDLFCGFLWVLSILCKYVGMFLICHCIFRRDAWRGLNFWSPVGIVGQKSLTGNWSTEERKTLEKNLAIFAVLVATEGES